MRITYKRTLAPLAAAPVLLFSFLQETPAMPCPPISGLEAATFGFLRVGIALLLLTTIPYRLGRGEGLAASPAEAGSTIAGVLACEARR